jgi:hypothetical protein
MNAPLDPELEELLSRGAGGTTNAEGRANVEGHTAEVLTPVFGKPSLNPVPVGELDGRAVADLSGTERLALCHEYFLTGNLSALARKHAVRYTELLDLAREPWWEEEQRALEQEALSQARAKLSSLSELAFGQLEDRLTHGDWVVLPEGDKVRAPMRGRDLSAVLSNLFDKKRLVDESLAKGSMSNETRKLLQLADALRSRVGYGSIQELAGGTTNIGGSLGGPST